MDGLLSKAMTLLRLDGPEEAVAVSDDLIARFGEAFEPALRESVRLARERRTQGGE